MKSWNRDRSADPDTGLGSPSTLVSVTAGKRSGPADAVKHPGGDHPDPQEPANAGELLQAVGLVTTHQSVADFTRAIEGLDTDRLIAIAEEIDRLPTTDKRTWKLRGKLISQIASMDPDAAFGYAATISKRHVRVDAMGTAAIEIARGDLARALSLAAGIEDTAAFQSVAKALAGSGAEGAPEAVLGLLKERGVTHLAGGYRTMFANWSRTDLQAAIANLSEVPAGEQQADALQGIASVFDSESLEEGLAFAASLPPGQRYQVLSTITASVASSAPQEALAIYKASKLPPNQKKSLLASIAGEWLRADPEKAKDWIVSLESTQEKTSVLRSSINHLGRDLGWVAEQVALLPFSKASSDLSITLVREWSRQDPVAAADWFDRLPDGDTRLEALRALTGNWAMQDPHAAANFLSEESFDGGDIGHAASQVAVYFTGADPRAAIAWVRSIEDSSRTGGRLLSSAIRSWAHSAPEEAADYVLDLEGNEQHSSFRSLMSTWGGNDFDGAAAWIEQIGDTELRNTALGALVVGTGHTHPDRAAAALAEASAGVDSEAANELFGSATRILASSWAQNDPVAAAAWAANLPESADRSYAVGVTVGSWARDQPRSVSEWLSTLDGGPVRDQGIQGLMRTIERTDPEGALSWAASMDDPTLRIHWARQTMMRWRDADRDAALAALESTDFNVEDREELLDLFN